MGIFNLLGCAFDVLLRDMVTKSEETMKKRITAVIGILTIIISISFAGCAQNQAELFE